MATINVSSLSPNCLLESITRSATTSKATSKEIIALLEVPISVLAEKMDMAYIKLVFFYLCEAKDKAFQQELQHEFHTTLQPILGDEFMVSIADAYRQEGMEKGMHLAKLEDAHEMLVEGINEAVIAKITKLSLDEIRREALKLKTSLH